MNSFSFIARGIEAEVERQVGVWESGGEVRQETYDFDAATSTLTPRRAKEEADDYRYFPEPDLVAVEPDAELVERARAEIGELPGARIRRLEAEVGFDLAYGLVTGGRDELYARVPGADRRAVANVLMNQLAAAVATFVMILAAGYLLWMFQRVVFGEASDFIKGLGSHLTDMRPVEALTLVPLGALVVVFGLYPGLLIDLVAGSVDTALGAVQQVAPVAMRALR